MFARVHTLETTVEQHDAGLAAVRDDLLPWARECDGFRGLIGLDDRSRGSTLVVTLWATEEELAASASAADRLSRLAAETTGAKRTGLDSYRVTLIELAPEGRLGRSRAASEQTELAE